MDLLEEVPYHRLPCIAHCLQLVIKVVYKHSTYQTVITKARDIVANIRKSANLIDKLVTRCGKSVVMDCTTRWNSTNSMIKCFIDVKETVNKVLAEVSVDTLVASE